MIRERPSFKTLRNSSASLLSGIGCGMLRSVDAAFAATEPTPAPAKPRRAVAPIPSARAGPKPGIRNRVVTTRALVTPAAPPATPPAKAPNSMARLAASVSEVVRKTMDSSGTSRCKSSFKAFSARSRELKTPIAVSIESSPCVPLDTSLSAV